VLPGGVTVENEDIALCTLTATGAGTTACTWSAFFDGSTATLDSAVKALDVLPNGSLVMAVGGDGSIADLSAIKAKDLALFIPDDPLALPYGEGEWRLFLDGDAVKGSTDGRVWDAVSVLPDGDVLVSVSQGGTLGAVTFENEDILRCHPTAFSSGGAITGCDYSLFLDGSAIQLTGGGAGGYTSNLFAFEILSPSTLLMRVGGSANLPAHRRATTCSSTLVRWEPACRDVDLVFEGDSRHQRRAVRRSPSSPTTTATASRRPRQLPGRRQSARKTPTATGGRRVHRCENRLDPDRCGDGILDHPTRTAIWAMRSTGSRAAPARPPASELSRTGTGQPCETAPQCPADRAAAATRPRATSSATTATRSTTISRERCQPNGAGIDPRLRGRGGPNMFRRS
jgi:hypothetical protein